MSQARSEPHIPAAALGELVKINPWLSLAPFVWTWSIIVAAIVLQLRWGSIWTVPIAMLFVARSQHALAILMHEGAHARLLRSRWWNDFVGSWFAGYTVLISLPAYRSVHLVHHKDPIGPTDPDVVLTSGYPVSRGTLARRLLRDLFGISFFKVLSYVLTGVTRRARKRAKAENLAAPQPRAADRNPYGPITAQEISKAIAVQAGLLAVCWSFGQPLAYLTLWLVPMMTVLQVLLRLRGLADHAGLPEATVDRALPQYARTRTVISNPVTRFFLAPLHVGYHLEHHLYVGLPWYRLRAAHQILRPAFESAGAPMSRGYVDVFRDLTRVTRG